MATEMTPSNGNKASLEHDHEHDAVHLKNEHDQNNNPNLHNQPTYLSEDHEHDHELELGNAENQAERHRAERKVIWKLDRVIIPLTALLYLGAFLDRGNAGNAKLQGFLKDVLDNSSQHYSVVLSVFYVTYILFNVPGCMLLEVIPPNYAIALGAMIWGIASSSQAASFNYAGVIVCRAFIGIGEACFGPAIPFYFSLWYLREEVAFRTALFIGAGTLAGALGGLIAYGIQGIHSHVETWRILFMIEGLPVIILSILVFFILPSTPSKSNYLNETERQIVLDRLARENLVEKHSHFDWDGVQKAVKDYKIYVCGAIYMAVQLTVASVSGFLPTILATFGFSTADAQLVSVAPYAVAFFVMITISYISDKLKLRGPFIAGAFVCTATGYSILLGSHTSSHHLRYFSVFLIVSGGFTEIPLMLSWVSNNAPTISQRAVQLGMLNGIGQTFSILAAFLFPASQGPKYTRAFSANVAVAVIASLLTVGLMFSIKRDNAMKDRLDAQAGPSRILSTFSDQEEKKDVVKDEVEDQQQEHQRRQQQQQQAMEDGVLGEDHRLHSVANMERRFRYTL